MTAAEGYPAPVPVLQRTDEFDQLLALYRARRPTRVLEVGSYEGGTLYHWLVAARPGAVVVSIDNHSMGSDNRHLYAEWAPAGVSVHAIVGDSRAEETRTAARLLGPYDWVFIDADHSYAAVAADWASYGQMCAPGAVIALHDILPASAAYPEIQVSRLWAEIKVDHTTTEFIADRAAPWGGIGVVFLGASETVVRA